LFFNFNSVFKIVFKNRILKYKNITKIFSEWREIDHDNAEIIRNFTIYNVEYKYGYEHIMFIVMEYGGFSLINYTLALISKYKRNKNIINKNINELVKGAALSLKFFHESMFSKKFYNYYFYISFNIKLLLILFWS
jgi:hypothetical protein